MTLPKPVLLMYFLLFSRSSGGSERSGCSESLPWDVGMISARMILRCRSACLERKRDGPVVSVRMLGAEEAGMRSRSACLGRKRRACGVGPHV